MATVWAVVAGILGAWIAAGSVGALSHPLRICLTWLALFVAVVAAWPTRGWPKRLVLAVAMMVALPLFLPTSPSHEVLLVGVVLAMLASVREGTSRTILCLCAWSVFAFAVFRLAYTSIPGVWFLGNGIATALAKIVTVITGKPMAIGSSFAGIDFLVLMLAWYVGWLWQLRKPRLGIAVGVAAAILAGHLLYLILLAHALDIARWLPTVETPPFKHPYTPPAWRWTEAARQSLPWDLPIIGATLNAIVVAFMVRWSPWYEAETPPVASQSDAASSVGKRWALSAVLLLAVLLPASATLLLQRCDLSGKTVLVYHHEHMNWRRPQHDLYGQASAGVFGMLPALIGSLGATVEYSEDLPEEKLAGADVLLILHPRSPLPAQCCQRIWEYVRNGGAVLVVAEPSVEPGDPVTPVNQLLEPTNMSLRLDVAISVTNSWQHGYQVLPHPSMTSMDGRSGRSWTDVGTSIQLRWPAQPLLVGRWGWSDPGRDAAATTVARFETGERLGDVVLAAEQAYGTGTFLTLGDSYSLTNEGLVRGYMFVGRLLSYLANRPGHPLTPLRQAFSLGLCCALLVLAVAAANARQLVWVNFLLALSLAGCTQINKQLTQILPDGRLVPSIDDWQSRGLAYIDASHLEAHSDSDWEFGGINGLALALMRNGYLTLRLPEMTRERLTRAALVVSIAPARRFSQTERSLLRDFVSTGGILLLTVGAEEAAASEALLADFGMRVPRTPVPNGGSWQEPEPMGHVRARYSDGKTPEGGDYQAGVMFHAAWPVECDADGAQVLVRHENKQPIVIARKLDSGWVVVIGDTGFAMNKNLEYIGGEPFENGYENAHFWRWLISRLTGGPEWMPPPPVPAVTNDVDAESAP